jgi:serine protease Do
MRLATLRAAALATAVTPGLLMGTILTPVVLAPVLFAAPAMARGAPDSFADLAEKLAPAVVNISSLQAVQAKADRPDSPAFPPGSPFEQFFHDFMERHGQGQGQGHDGGGGDQPDQPSRRGQALGSGFIIDPSGIIVTNNHVIEGADEITVTLHDGTSLKAKLVGHDDRSDVAVLKVTSDKPLPFVPFADSDTARVGDWVLAIGNPFGLGGSVTAGIVSARGRDIRQGPYDDFIQTDAAINRGNSGGPLFNMDGQVIGINTAIYSPSGGSIGIGFAIPANMAKLVVAQLRDYGHAKRGWLGVQIQQVTPDIADGVGLHPPRGAMVAGISDNGPAAAAKIRGGDIILSFNGQDVKEMRTLPRIVAETEIGKQVPVTLWRDGKEMTVQASIAELPDDVQQVSTSPAAPKKAPVNQAVDIGGLGLKLSPITDELRTKYSIGADQKGVVVTDVAPNGDAAQRGLKAGDVVVEVQQEAVNSPADVQERVDRFRKLNRKTVLMLIQNSDGLRWVPLPLTSDRKPG